MKSRILLDKKILTKSLNKLYQRYKNKIIEIILFGSFVKNKSNPHDIDIAIILKNSNEQELLSLVKKFTQFFDRNVHLNLVLIETIFSNPLFRTLLSEGKSLLDNKPLHEKLGYESGSIFSFNLTKLEKSKKVLFYYALHGKHNHNHKGILQNANGKQIGRTVMYIPINCVSDFQDFLETWKVDFYRMDILKA